MSDVRPLAMPTTMVLHEKLGYKENRSLLESFIHFFAEKFGRNPKSLSKDHDRRLVANSSVEFYLKEAKNNPKTELEHFQQELTKALVSCPTIKDKSPENLNETINLAVGYIRSEMRNNPALFENYQNSRKEYMFDWLPSDLTDEDVSKINDQYKEEMKEYEKNVEKQILSTLAGSLGISEEEIKE